MKEVKRSAIVGDWVKVVDKKDTFGSSCGGGTNYEVGQIFQVKGVHEKYKSLILYPYWVTDREYVVLEDYKPTQVKHYTIKILADEMTKYKKAIGTAGEDLKAGDLLMIDKNGYLVKHRVEKRKWTNEQIQEAKDIVYGFCTNIAYGYAITFVITGEKTLARKIQDIGRKTWTEVSCNRSTPSPNDEYNIEIGKMVACCKLLHESLPKWVLG